MRPSCLSVILLALALVGLGLAAAGVFGLRPAAAEDEAPAPEGEERAKLEKHPFADAKPGEYLRYVESSERWKKWFVERIIAVKDGEVYWEIAQTNDEGSKDLSVLRSGWLKIPEFKPTRYQKIKKDEMVWLEVGDKKLWCRHLVIEQPEQPPFEEPKIRREVWYSNDVPCSGKVKEEPRGRLVSSWGTMPEEELKRRQEQLEKRERGEKKNEG